MCNGEHPRTKTPDLLSIATASAAIGALFMNSFQLILMQKSNNVTMHQARISEEANTIAQEALIRADRQAKIAEDANKTAREALNRTEGPTIHPVFDLVREADTDISTVVLKIYNFGKTPALNIKHNFIVVRKGSLQTPEFPGQAFMDSNVSLIPGSVIEVRQNSQVYLNPSPNVGRINLSYLLIGHTSYSTYDNLNYYMKICYNIDPISYALTPCGWGRTNRFSQASK